ncbi:superoxide dismutase [Patescibacteria group bacterium]|nr:superoxide dismutase [Patescibacteria group bacterium]MBU4057348.1 superoxide dismutase [Patescibacteria group bacterium]MBU4115823.1 superoxide dismutase [Patescibacteria group bacterium]
MFIQPKLNYSFDVFEPHIDKETMKIHYGKHHMTYYKNFNDIIQKYPNLRKMSLKEILMNLPFIPVDETDRKKIQNNGGGSLNHDLFWKIMDPNNKKDQNLAKEIEIEFGNIKKFKEIFSQTALNQFGSGWAWLVRDKNKKLKIYSLPNQDSPLSIGDIPLLCLDVWEHAYYLKYQNRRADYIANWWNIIKII